MRTRAGFLLSDFKQFRMRLAKHIHYHCAVKTLAHARLHYTLRPRYTPIKPAVEITPFFAITKALQPAADFIPKAFNETEAEAPLKKA
jgi:hypothetical protein